MPTKTIRAAIAALLLPLAVTACSGGADAPAAAKPGEIAGLSLKDGALILPAVKGNPGVIYGTFVNASERALALRAVAVDGAQKAEVHAMMEWSGKMTMGETGPQVIPAKGQLELKSGGLHVMVFDLAPTVTAGGSAVMTITIAGGDTAKFTVPVRAAGAER